MYGNVSEPEDTGVWSPEKSSLFFLTAYYPGIGLTGDRVTLAGKAHLVLMCSVRSHRSLKIRGIDLFTRLVVL